MYLYEHFNLYNPFVTVDLVVWAMFAGFVAAAIMAVYNKRVIGGFVKTVIDKDCLSPETAKTIVELEYGTDWFIKNALRTDTVLRRYVMRVHDAGTASEADADDADADAADGADGTKKKKKPAKKSAHEQIDFMTARFYIPEELKYTAEVRYASRGTNFVTLFIAVVALAALAFAAIFLIPELLQLIDNFLGTI